jgi:preprotein translocase subunit SecE
MEIEPITVSGAAKTFGMVIVFCIIVLLLIFGIEFLFFGKWILSSEV